VPETLDKTTIVPFIGEIFARQGAEEYLGEPVTIGHHMLQAAALAEEAGHDDATIIGALLHDIGHFTENFVDISENDEVDRLHEESGAEALAPFFPASVVDCVRWHVAAKRYLCAVKPSYFDRLSEASIHSLKLQGGPMSEEEVAVFRANPNLERIVRVRYIDEAAKDPAMATPRFDHWAPMAQRLVDAHCR